MDIRRRMLAPYGASYTVNLNSQWEATTAVPNPDSTLYDGVYRSASNYHVGNGVATMYITIKNCSSFKMYIRSYAESSFDYVMVSQLDKTITGSTSATDTTKVKAHTKGNQQSGTALSNYTLVEFTGISSGEHTITVVYRKDGSVDKGDDRGYVLIEKLHAGDSGSGSEGPINIDNYLTIEARENGLTASLSNNVCEYCVDGDGNWKTLSAGTATESINNGHTLSFRANLTPKSTNGIGRFTINKKCNLKGNCMSMLFGDDAVHNYSLSGKNYAFRSLFYNCSNIVNVSSNFLSARILADFCYASMFEGCSNLITVPILPSAAPRTSCYNSMFGGCTSLETAPELPATTLGNFCYGGMFFGCTSLTTAPELPATTLKDSCYANMFEGCTSLTTAPTLPAATLVGYCYERMFGGCTNLNYIKMLATDISANACLDEWVLDVPSNGKFIKNVSMTSLPRGDSGIPYGWTVQNA